MGFIELIIVIIIGPLVGAGILLLSSKLAQSISPPKREELESELPHAENNFTVTEPSESFDEKNPYAAGTATPGQTIARSAGMPSFFAAWLIAGICCVAFFAIWFCMFFLINTMSTIMSTRSTGVSAMLLILGIVCVPYLVTIGLKMILLAQFTRRRIGQVILPLMIDQGFWLLLVVPFVGFAYFGLAALDQQ